MSKPAPDGDALRLKIRVLPITASLAQACGLSLEELRAVAAGAREPTKEQRRRLIERLRMP